VVIAAEGYPAAPATGDEISGLDEAGQVPGAYVLHAGTAMAPQAAGTAQDGRLVSAGGRVLDVVGTGADLAAARAAAYAAAGKIRMRGSWYRSDIAERAAARAPAQP
jgi:phosphoribosylamine--glycine ligase